MTTIIPEPPNALTAYDEVPYPSYCYQASSPATLATVGTLFGVDAAPLNKARVLDLGCAAGGNIIPLAYLWPDADFVGVDLSSRQIQHGQKTVEDLELKNITLLALSVEDFLQQDHLPFDYIIAHGIYAWVNADARKAILAVCARSLAKNGLAYISYNTLPGWNAIRTIRDMMLYHTRTFEKPEKKVQEARRMLHFVAENVRGEASPYKKILESEIAILNRADDQYLLHDHLEATNSPCYFHEFMEKAAAHGLAYVGDADLPGMFVGSLKKAAAEKLGGMTDIVRQEQYMDFLNNRRFRSTILCRREVPLERNLQPEILQSMCLYTEFVQSDDQNDPVETIPAELRLHHRTNTDRQVTIRNKGVCAIMLALAEANGHPVSSAELMVTIGNRFPDFAREPLNSEFGTLVLRLVLKDIVNLIRDVPSYARVVPDRPRVFPVAAYIAKTANVVPDLWHEARRLSRDQRKIIEYADGSRTVDDIAECIRQEVDKGTLALEEEGESVSDSSDLQHKLRDYVRSNLDTLLEARLICS